MTTTKGDVRSDFTYIRHLMREWERVLKATPDDHDALLEIANELAGCAHAPLNYLEERGIYR